MDVSCEEAPPACPVAAVAGDRDQFVDTAAFSSWSDVDTHLVAGADHFFSGRHDVLGETLREIFRS